jgi:hypothetical protein
VKTQIETGRFPVNRLDGTPFSDRPDAPPGATRLRTSLATGFTAPAGRNSAVRNAGNRHAARACQGRDLYKRNPSACRHRFLRSTFRWNRNIAKTSGLPLKLPVQRVTVLLTTEPDPRAFCKSLLVKPIIEDFKASIQRILET